jgi:integrase
VLILLLTNLGKSYEDFIPKEIEGTTDVNKTVRINNPGKHGNSRIIKISTKLIVVLRALPRKSDRVFEGLVHSMRSNFGIQRRRVAEKLKNPRLLRISFHTFRH